jgi:hypothetical protein
MERSLAQTVASLREVAQHVDLTDVSASLGPDLKRALVALERERKIADAARKYIEAVRHYRCFGGDQAKVEKRHALAALEMAIDLSES